MDNPDEWSDSDEVIVNDLAVQPELKKFISYEILDEYDISNRQAEAIKLLSEEFQLEYSQASVLLIQNQWNPHKVIEKILNSELELPTLSAQFSQPSGSSLSNFCPSCYSSIQGEDMIGMDCGHYLCKVCYKNYLTESVNEGLVSIYTKCPIPECSIIVSNNLFKNLLDSDLYKKYQKFILFSFVDNQNDVKWCPASGCTNVAIYPKIQPRKILCSCGYSWCFSCGNESHRPLSCELYKEWNIRINKDDTRLWILANTKECPKCKNAIQKNEGCMHMTCKCGYEFCWICSADWHKHTGPDPYNCNKFTKAKKNSNANNGEMDEKQASIEIIKFQHYFDRFINHKNSLQAAKSKILEAESEIREFSSFFTEPRFFDFYLEAKELIYETKHALMNTYAYGYYIKSISKLIYFEFIQGDLEANMIKLENLISKDIKSFVKEDDEGLHLKKKFRSYKSKIIDLTKVVQGYFDQCLEQIEANFPEIQDGYVDASKYLGYLKVWICDACKHTNNNNSIFCQRCNHSR